MFFTFGMLHQPILLLESTYQGCPSQAASYPELCPFFFKNPSKLFCKKCCQIDCQENSWIVLAQFTGVLVREIRCWTSISWMPLNPGHFMVIARVFLLYFLHIGGSNRWGWCWVYYQIRQVVGAFWSSKKAFFRNGMDPWKPVPRSSWFVVCDERLCIPQDGRADGLVALRRWSSGVIDLIIFIFISCMVIWYRVKMVVLWNVYVFFLYWFIYFKWLHSRSQTAALECQIFM